MSIDCIKQCRLCGNPDLVPVCDLGVMAFTGVFPKTPVENVPDGCLELVACHGDNDKVCGLVQLRHTFDPHVLFGPSYGYRSGLNGAMAAHLGAVASKIKSFVQLNPGDVVVDVGSSDGTLLRSFSGHGLCLLGIDPTAAHFAEHYPADVRIFSEFFSPDLVHRQLGGRKVKAVTAVAVFYDMASPLDFLCQVYDMLADDGVLVLEQNYWPHMLKESIYDMICHEHVAYYGARQMKWLADRSGFKVVHSELNEVNGGSLCLVLAKQELPLGADEAFLRLAVEEELAFSDSLDAYHVFSENILRHRDALREKVRALHAQGMSVAGYGASTKGNVLLQFCGFTAGDIQFIAEINKDKSGRTCPGTHIPIIMEEEARSRKPDVFVVLPWHLKKAVLAREQHYLGQGGFMLFPFPGIHTVNGLSMG